MFLTIVEVSTETLSLLSQSISVSSQNVLKIFSVLVIAIASPVLLWNMTVLKIFSAYGHLLAFLIFLFAVVIRFSKLSITNKNERNLASC